MAKNILHYCNYDHYIWVDILHVKYGMINSWKDNILAYCSGFFRRLSHSAYKLNSCFWMKSVNPNQTSFLYHPWCTDTPLAFNPTYINTDLDLCALTISNLTSNDTWNREKLCLLFGDNMVYFSHKLGSIDYTASNHWVWSPKSHKNNLSSFIYHFLNHNLNWVDDWVGWKKL